MENGHPGGHRNAEVNMQKVSSDEQYKYLTSHLEYLDKRIFDIFILFIKLATAIIGGVFFLKWKLMENCLDGNDFVLPSNILFCGVGAFLILLLSINLLAWKNYRTTLSENYGIPRSRQWWRAELIMCAAIFVACLLFCLSNPLAGKSQSMTIAASSKKE